VGANEVLSYSFVSEKIFKKAHQSPDEALRITNSISPDLQYYRHSLTPSLLSKISQNIHARETNFAIFELNKVSQKNAFDESEPTLPAERNRLAFVLTDVKKTGTAFYAAKEILKDLFGKDTPLSFVQLDESQQMIDQPFEFKRSAWVFIGDKYAGIVGEYKSSVKQSFKLPGYTAGFELELDAVFPLVSRKLTIEAESIYQDSVKDLTFKLPKDTPYEVLADALKAATTLDHLQIKTAALGIFSDNDETKNISFRLTLADRRRNLDMAAITEIIDKIVKKVEKEANAKII
jgi:phenylalanyl-tRNA synthetase beta subunit